MCEVHNDTSVGVNKVRNETNSFETASSGFYGFAAALLYLWLRSGAKTAGKIFGK
jgi:hypothetical protein